MAIFCWQVKWVRLLYNDFSAFTKDQERLISINGRKQNLALDYVEGMLLMHQGPINNWRSSFFPLADHPRIISLVTEHSILYCLEVAKYYDEKSENNVDKVPTLVRSNCPFVLFFLSFFLSFFPPFFFCLTLITLCMHSTLSVFLFFKKTISKILKLTN